MESILGDWEVLSGKTRVIAKKCHNWIALKVLLEFTEAALLGVAMELILGDGEVLLGQTRVTAQKDHNF